MSEVGPSKEAEARAVQDLSRVESGAEVGGETRSPVSLAEVLPWHKLRKGDCPLGKWGSVHKHWGSVHFYTRYCYLTQLREHTSCFQTPTFGEAQGPQIRTQLCLPKVRACPSEPPCLSDVSSPTDWVIFHICAERS